MRATARIDSSGDTAAMAKAGDDLQGRLSAALEDYSRATQLNPQHCRAYYNRAFTLDALDRLEEARLDYDVAIQLEPFNATAFHNRGSLHERLGDIHLALKGGNRQPVVSLSHCVRGGQCRHRRAPMYSSRHAHVCADYDAAIKLDPHAALTHNARGLLLESQGDLEGALAAYEKAVSLERDVAFVRNRGLCYRAAGQVETALQDLNTCAPALRCA